MPHVDELLGVTTVAAAGLFAAILLQPIIGEVAVAGAHDAARLAAVAVARIANAGAGSQSPAQRAN